MKLNKDGTVRRHGRHTGLQQRRDQRMVGDRATSDAHRELDRESRENLRERRESLLRQLSRVRIHDTEEAQGREVPRDTEPSITQQRRRVRRIEHILLASSESATRQAEVERGTQNPGTQLSQNTNPFEVNRQRRLQAIEDQLQTTSLPPEEVSRLFEQRDRVSQTTDIFDEASSSQTGADDTLQNLFGEGNSSSEIEVERGTQNRGTQLSQSTNPFEVNRQRRLQAIEDQLQISSLPPEEVPRLFEQYERERQGIDFRAPAYDEIDAQRARAIELLQLLESGEVSPQTWFRHYSREYRQVAPIDFPIISHNQIPRWQVRNSRILAHAIENIVDDTRSVMQQIAEAGEQASQESSNEMRDRAEVIHQLHLAHLAEMQPILHFFGLEDAYREVTSALINSFIITESIPAGMEVAMYRLPADLHNIDSGLIFIGEFLFNFIQRLVLFSVENLAEIGVVDQLSPEMTRLSETRRQQLALVLHSFRQFFDAFEAAPTHQRARMLGDFIGQILPILLTMRVPNLPRGLSGGGNVGARVNTALEEFQARLGQLIPQQPTAAFSGANSAMRPTSVLMSRARPVQTIRSAGNRATSIASRGVAEGRSQSIQRSTTNPALTESSPSRPIFDRLRHLLNPTLMRELEEIHQLHLTPALVRLEELIAIRRARIEGINSIFEQINQMRRQWERQGLWGLSGEELVDRGMITNTERRLVSPENGYRLQDERIVLRREVHLLEEERLNVRRVIFPHEAWEVLEHADRWGIHSYRYLTRRVSGRAIEVHHLIERRFAIAMGEDVQEMLSIVLTASEHGEFTAAWNTRFPQTIYQTGTTALSRTQILDAAREIYRNYPRILRALGLE